MASYWAPKFLRASEIHSAHRHTVWYVVRRRLLLVLIILVDRRNLHMLSFAAALVASARLCSTRGRHAKFEDGCDDAEANEEKDGDGKVGADAKDCLLLGGGRAQ